MENKNKLEETICEYFRDCNVKKISGRNCADYENCQTWKFYDKHGQDYLGVGAMVKINNEMENYFRSKE